MRTSGGFGVKIGGYINSIMYTPNTINYVHQKINKYQLQLGQT